MTFASLPQPPRELQRFGIPDSVWHPPLNTVPGPNTALKTCYPSGRTVFNEELHRGLGTERNVGLAST